MVFHLLERYLEVSVLVHAWSVVFMVIGISVSRSVVQNFVMVINEPFAIITALSKNIIDEKGFKRFWSMVVTIFNNDLGVGFSGNPLKVLKFKWKTRKLASGFMHGEDLASF